MSLKTSLVSRVGAVLIDNLLIYGLGIGILIKLNMDSQQAIGVMSILFVLYSIMMPVYCKGYHIGKNILGMKIVSDTYRDPSWIQMIKREVVKMSYAIPVIGIVFLLISQYMMSAREDGKTLHDLVAHTQVIRV